ncbi:interleukin-21 isoform X1 [Phyllopteryx taeniolatus]|uniref:interleukin-21 isoform X1 n=2 Tax=Phyllopteryx taeniolatus TaxID=161469 RepID=UPI002AD4F83E|nr:interleukin-21 isoform X1 [Phyllopteryx taeniolatus]
MKLVLLCLLAVCCSSLASATDMTLERRKLVEVLRQLGDVKDSLQHGELLVNTPPQNIEDCCCLSALRCFRASLHVQFNLTERRQNKLYRSLKHPITERGLDLCKSGNAVATCATCDSHPKTTAREFVNRLESLIQKAISRLSVN